MYKIKIFVMGSLHIQRSLKMEGSQIIGTNVVTVQDHMWLLQDKTSRGKTVFKSTRYMYMHVLFPVGLY